MYSNRKRGFTLLELAITTGILSVGILLFIPLLSQSIDEARQLSCARYMARLGTGMLNYTVAHGALPRGRGFPDWTRNGVVQSSYTNYDNVRLMNDETDFLSAFTKILPFIDRQDVADLIVLNTGKRLFVNGTLINPNYLAAEAAGKLFICPADSNTSPGGIAEGNYRVNFGGDTPYGGAPSVSFQDRIGSKYFDPQRGYSVSLGGNGAFTYGDGLRLRKFLDGTGKTALLSERTKGSGQSSDLPPQSSDVMERPDNRVWLGPMNIDAFYQACSNEPVQPDMFNFSGPGRFLPGSDFSNGWLFAGYDTTQYNHVAPPNWFHPDCSGYSPIADTPGEHAIMAARSMHPGIVNVVFADGRVEAVADTIDLQVWRNMGARNNSRNLQPVRNGVASQR